jgi:hypothetical protein
MYDTVQKWTEEANNQAMIDMLNSIRFEGAESTNKVNTELLEDILKDIRNTNTKMKIWKT